MSRTTPSPRRVALVTYKSAPKGTADDQLLLSPLAKLGVTAEFHSWDEASIAWSDFDAVVIRSTWDYFKRPGEFRAWLEALERSRANVWNPLPVLRWNMDKRYLTELEARGVPIVPTRWSTPDAPLHLDDLLDHRGWSDIVVKPTVSGGAYETYRVSRKELRAGGEHRARFDALAARMPLMIQPFLPSIATEGEWSFLFCGDEFSHAVIKRPRAGDFRVQQEHGGDAKLATPPAEALDAARAVLAAAPGPRLYARVDGCVLHDHFALMELEILEPSLFLGQAPGAAERFAREILRRIESR